MDSSYGLHKNTIPSELFEKLVLRLYLVETKDLHNFETFETKGDWDVAY